MTRLFYLFVFAAFALSSCNKAANAVTNSLPSSGNSLTINGDIFKNQPLNINVVVKTIDTFFSTTNLTSLSVGGLASDSLTVNMVISFSGKSILPSTPFAITSPIVIISIAPVTNPSAARNYSSSTGNLIVSSYGALGTNISGTFSGTFTPTFGTSTGITVTNGAFSVKRTN